jgi:hypothetical protein
MKRTIKEVYDLIKEKMDNAENELKKEEDKLYRMGLRGEIEAYKDVLYLIENSHLSEEDKSVKGNALEALERIIGCNTIESHTQKWREDYRIIEKALKALEIIKNCLIGEYELIDNAPLDKVFNSPYRFRVWADYMHCNEWIVSKEEYDLLKEVFQL